MASGFAGQGGRFGADTLNDFGGAVSDIFSMFGDSAKAQGDQFELENYDAAAALADKNAAYTEQSTGIQLAQLDRNLSKSLGQTTADVAGAGFASSGSALDILRDSAQQGALTKQVAQEQGDITEAGYQEQAQSYRNMAQAAQTAIDADNQSGIFAGIAGGIKLAASIATLA